MPKRVKITVLKKEFYPELYGSVSAISSGSSFAPWNKREGQTIVCCTDGIRPVIFDIQAMEENSDRDRSTRKT